MSAREMIFFSFSRSNVRPHHDHDSKTIGPETMEISRHGSYFFFFLAHRVRAILAHNLNVVSDTS